MLRTLLPAAALVASANLTLAQDIDQGAIAFKKCAICHKIGAGATNGIGPELNGLDGRFSGSVTNSVTLMRTKTRDSSGMRKLLKDTSKILRQRFPGPKRCSPASSNEKETKDLWAYLKQFNAQGNLNR